MSQYELEKVTYQFNDGTVQEFVLSENKNATGQIDIPEGVVDIHVYYTNTLTPPPGVFSGHLGAVFAMLAAVTVMMGAYLFTMTKRRREER